MTDENEHDDQRVSIAVLSEQVKQLIKRQDAADRKIWGAILGVLGITITIASEILKAGIQ